MNQRLIVIDGKTYKSVEEMPEEVRRKYESAMSQLDRNNDGTPDMLEKLNLFADKNEDGMPDALEGMVANVTTSTKIIADGKEYNSLDELPPEMRAKYEQAMGAMDANRNGIPDFMEGMISTPKQMPNAATSLGIETPSPALHQPIPASPRFEIDADSLTRPLRAISVLLLLGLCAGGAIFMWYILSR